MKNGPVAAARHRAVWAALLLSSIGACANDYEILPVRAQRSEAALQVGGARPTLGHLAVTHEWTSVSLPSSYAAPVVIAGPPSTEGTDPATVRVRHVAPDRFELRVQEWDYLDGIHKTENVSYLVLEAGIHLMPDGSVWEAGTFTLSGHGAWQHTAFQSHFDASPFVFLTVQSNNAASAITARARNVTTHGFDSALFEHEASDGQHAAETIAYLAIRSQGHGSDEVGRPYLVRELQADHGGSTVDPHVALYLEEEASRDQELQHAREQVHFLRIGDEVFAQIASAAGLDTVALRKTQPNLALGKPATQSSTTHSRPAALAVDGDRNGHWTGGSVTHTEGTARAWWQVDLGASFTISSVVLWNRLDCCSDRLSNFDVHLLDASGAVVASRHHPGTAAPVTTISSFSSSNARFVRVELRGSNVLSLAEVQVFGHGTPSDAPPGSSRLTCLCEGAEIGWAQWATSCTGPSPAPRGTLREDVDPASVGAVLGTLGVQQGDTGWVCTEQGTYACTCDSAYGCGNDGLGGDPGDVMRGVDQHTLLTSYHPDRDDYFRRTGWRCEFDCPSGQRTDCGGHCAPAGWLGNGECDQSIHAWGGVAVDFSCGAFDHDARDCDRDGDGLPDHRDLDDDGDGLHDDWQRHRGLSSSDAGDDDDEDGVSNAEEYAAGTDPLAEDTDRDGVDDGAELLAGRNPHTDEGPQVSIASFTGVTSGSFAGRWSLRTTVSSPFVAGDYVAIDGPFLEGNWRVLEREADGDLVLSARFGGDAAPAYEGYGMLRTGVYEPWHETRAHLESDTKLCALLVPAASPPADWGWANGDCERGVGDDSLFACRNLDNGRWQLAEGDPEDFWSGQRACMTAFGPRYRFSVPRNATEQSALGQVFRALRTAGSSGSWDYVWLNYRREPTRAFWGEVRTDAPGPRSLLANDEPPTAGSWTSEWQATTGSFDWVTDRTNVTMLTSAPGLSERTQEIDLVERGISGQELDLLPSLYVKADYRKLDCESSFILRVELLDASKRVLKTWVDGSAQDEPCGEGTAFRSLGAHLDDYPTGVRVVRVTQTATGRVVVGHSVFRVLEGRWPTQQGRRRAATDSCGTAHLEVRAASYAGTVGADELKNRAKHLAALAGITAVSGICTIYNALAQAYDDWIYLAESRQARSWPSDDLNLVRECDFLQKLSLSKSDREAVIEAAQAGYTGAQRDLYEAAVSYVAETEHPSIETCAKDLPQWVANEVQFTMETEGLAPHVGVDALLTRELELEIATSSSWPTAGTNCVPTLEIGTADGSKYQVALENDLATKPDDDLFERGSRDRLRVPASQLVSGSGATLQGARIQDLRSARLSLGCSTWNPLNDWDVHSVGVYVNGRHLQSFDGEFVHPQTNGMVRQFGIELSPGDSRNLGVAQATWTIHRTDELQRFKVFDDGNAPGTIAFFESGRTSWGKRMRIHEGGADGRVIKTLEIDASKRRNLASFQPATSSCASGCTLTFEKSGGVLGHYSTMSRTVTVGAGEVEPGKTLYIRWLERDDRLGHPAALQPGQAPDAPLQPSCCEPGVGVKCGQPGTFEPSDEDDELGLTVFNVGTCAGVIADTEVPVGAGNPGGVAPICPALPAQPPAGAGPCVPPANGREQLLAAWGMQRTTGALTPDVNAEQFVRIHTLPVGNAACHLIECSGNANVQPRLVVYDCGRSGVTWGTGWDAARMREYVHQTYQDLCPGGGCMPPAVFVSHPHADHFDHVAELFDAAQAHHLPAPNAVHLGGQLANYGGAFGQWLAQQPPSVLYPLDFPLNHPAGGPLTAPIACGVANLHVRSANASHHGAWANNQNFKSLVLEVAFTPAGGAAEFHGLLAGDAVEESEQLAINHGGVQAMDFVSGNHHGAVTHGSNSQPWVDMLAANFVVFSAGSNNLFRHPRFVAVDRYLRLGGNLAAREANNGMLFGAAALHVLFAGRRPAEVEPVPPPPGPAGNWTFRETRQPIHVTRDSGLLVMEALLFRNAANAHETMKRMVVYK